MVKCSYTEPCICTQSRLLVMYNIICIKIEFITFRKNDDDNDVGAHTFNICITHKKIIQLYQRC